MYISNVYSPYGAFQYCLHIAALAISETYIYEGIPSNRIHINRKYFKIFYIFTISKQKLFGNTSKRVQTKFFLFCFFGGFFGNAMQIQYLYATNLSTKSIQYVT